MLIIVFFWLLVHCIVQGGFSAHGFGSAFPASIGSGVSSTNFKILDFFEIYLVTLFN